MNAKMYLFGLAGGAVCTLLLWYPLAEYLPSAILPAWNGANPTLAWALIIAAALAVLASGAIAARNSGVASRGGAMLSGATIGLMSTLLPFMILGGAAAGTWGARSVLAFGLRQAANQAQFLQFIVDAVLGIHGWTVWTLWGCILAGLLLGGLGGLFAGPGGEADPEMPLIYQVMGVAGVLASNLNITLTTIILGLLGAATQKTIIENQLQGLYPVFWLLVFPILTNFVAMYASIGLWWAFYRRGLSTGQKMDAQVRAGAIVLVATPVANSLLLIALKAYDPLWLYLPLFLLGILPAAAILWHVWQNSTNSTNLALTRHTIVVSTLLSLLVITVTIYFGTVPAALGDVMLVVSMIAPLNPDGTQASQVGSVVQLVMDHYATYRNTALTLIFVILPIFTLIISGLCLLAIQIFSRVKKPLAQAPA